MRKTYLVRFLYAYRYPYIDTGHEPIVDPACTGIVSARRMRARRATADSCFMLAERALDRTHKVWTIDTAS